MKIAGIRNSRRDIASYTPQLITAEVIEEVKVFHESFAEYTRSSLYSLHALAKNTGTSEILVKDESTRFNLNSFKVLGAAYAIGKVLARELGEPLSALPFPVLKQRVQKELSHITLTAATDGNHGRGVAWIGQQLGIPVHIFMPKGSVKARSDHILEEGGQVSVMDTNYDDTVRYVMNKAAAENWIIIQDTAWDGYEDVPRWIMQGYSTIAREFFEDQQGRLPSHVFIQAGVGAFAGAVTETLHVLYGGRLPKIIVVEAEAANCYYRSAVEGKDVIITGDLATIMAGLSCGEQNPLGNRILTKTVDVFISSPDWAAANGMRILANPIPGDPLIISGESGAVCVGVLERLMNSPLYDDLRALLELDGQSRILCFSTEGDTDPNDYRDVIWFGQYPEPEGE